MKPPVGGCSICGGASNSTQYRCNLGPSSGSGLNDTHRSSGDPIRSHDSAEIRSSAAGKPHDVGGGGKKGSAMLGDEMIDEASRKMALVIAGKGRAAGMERTSSFTPPEE